jgi:hypothetical protein
MSYTALCREYGCKFYKTCRHAKRHQRDKPCGVCGTCKKIDDQNQKGAK